MVLFPGLETELCKGYLRPWGAVLLIPPSRPRQGQGLQEEMRARPRPSGVAQPGQALGSGVGETLCAEPGAGGGAQPWAGEPSPSSLHSTGEEPKGRVGQTGDGASSPGHLSLLLWSPCPQPPAGVPPRLGKGRREARPPSGVHCEESVTRKGSEDQTSAHYVRILM